MGEDGTADQTVDTNHPCPHPFRHSRPYPHATLQYSTPLTLPFSSLPHPALLDSTLLYNALYYSPLFSLFSSTLLFSSLLYHLNVPELVHRGSGGDLHQTQPDPLPLLLVKQQRNQLRTAVRTQRSRAGDVH